MSVAPAGAPPPRVFDAHLHIIDPRFPLVPNQGYLPPPFTCADYLARTAHYDLAGGAVVSGSFQAFDQGYLLDALARLGPRFVGVTQLPADTPEAQILRLRDAGVRALRFNLRRGGSEDLSQLERIAARAHDLADWHVEFYLDARELDELAPRLARLPRCSIDHLGLSAAGLPQLLRLAERGVRVKATGFARGDLDVPLALRALHAANPHALMFGTDLPGTRAPRPYADTDLQCIVDTLGEPAARAVLCDNACAWYRRAS